MRRDYRINALVSRGLGYSILRRAGYFKGFTFTDWVCTLHNLAQYYTTSVEMVTKHMFGATLWRNKRGIISIRQSYIQTSFERRLWGMLDNIFRDDTKAMLVTWFALTDKPYSIRGMIDVDITKFSIDEMSAMCNYIKDTQLVFDDMHTLQRYAFISAVDPLVFKMYMRDFEGTRNLASTMKSVKGADTVLVSLCNIINCKII